MVKKNKIFWKWKRIQHLFVSKDDPPGVVQRGLEGEAPQVVAVLQVNVVPLHHQSRP